ncbi:MAG: hypothetical protein HUK15_08540 [Bacteroidales bacterium]|nr:hypothetical protein [Bacteroidales bacterium]
MKRGIIILATIFSLFAASEAKAQSSPEEIMASFFKIFETDVDKAIDYLFATNEWLAGNQDGANAMKEKLNASRKLLGNFNGYEIASKYAVGECYIKYTYILKYDRQPIGLVVTMYKPQDIWKLQNLNFQSDMEKEMEKIK